MVTHSVLNALIVALCKLWPIVSHGGKRTKGQDSGGRHEAVEAVEEDPQSAVAADSDDEVESPSRNDRSSTPPSESESYHLDFLADAIDAKMDKMAALREEEGEEEDELEQEESGAEMEDEEEQEEDPTSAPRRDRSDRGKDEKMELERGDSTGVWVPDSDDDGEDELKHTPEVQAAKSLSTTHTLLRTHDITALLQRHHICCASASSTAVISTPLIPPPSCCIFPFVFCVILWCLKQKWSNGRGTSITCQSVPCITSCGKTARTGVSFVS
jgi:hypothetical protein